jgi:phosphoribosyl 1,2-cyclic phosphodiesterase
VGLRYVSLASGSRGNAALVESDDVLLMIDCGLPRDTVLERLACAGREPRDITAILVTHEHGDHVRGVNTLAARHAIPVWATAGTAGASRLRHLPSLHTFSCHRGLRFGNVEVEPLPVPHDAREPCQFVFRAAGRQLAIVTDVGHVTRYMLERLAGSDALAVEFNHDLDLLERGPYPEAVKRRVASRFGHLHNEAAVDLVHAVMRPELQWIMALHLSEQNNTPERVSAAMTAALTGTGQRGYLAAQHSVSAWLDVV